MAFPSPAVPADLTDTGPREHGTPPARARVRRWNTALAVACALCLVLAGHHRRWTADGTLVQLRTVRQILAGHGPVFNAGERVEAVSSAAWQWLLAALGALLPTDLATLATATSLLLSATAVAVALDGSRVLHTRLTGRTPALLPVGVLVVLVLPPVWDAVAGGLETGLCFLWAALCWRLLLDLDPARPARSAPVCGVIGLGPLVRPELSIASAVLLVALLLVLRPPTRTALSLAGVAAVLPLGYEIFRAGYYGVLLPLPAIAREAALPAYDRGRLYLDDFLGPYWLGFSLTILAGLVLCFAVPDFEHRRPRSGAVRLGGREHALLILAPVVAGTGAGACVVRAGGDPMHARLLLPALFLVLLPVMAVPARLTLVPVTVLVALWAVACLHPGRVPYDGGYGGFLDESAYLTEVTGDRHPSEAARRIAAPQLTDVLRRAPHGPPSLWYFDAGPFTGTYTSVPLRPDVPPRTVVAAGQPGAAGSLVPLDQRAVDVWGTADVLAAHLVPRHERGPGHEKYLGNAWLLARYADPAALSARAAPAPFAGEPFPSAARVTAARHALDCGDLRELLRSAQDPLDPGRFWRNLAGAARRTWLRVPLEPGTAQRLFCARDTARDG